MDKRYKKKGKGDSVEVIYTNKNTHIEGDYEFTALCGVETDDCEVDEGYISDISCKRCLKIYNSRKSKQKKQQEKQSSPPKKDYDERDIMYIADYGSNDDMIIETSLKNLQKEVQAELEDNDQLPSTIYKVLIIEERQFSEIFKLEDF